MTEEPIRRSDALRVSGPASRRDVGKLAAVGLVVCCGLPLLISAGVLAAIGGVLRSPWVIAAGLALAVSATAYARARRRAGSCSCDAPHTGPVTGKRDAKA